MNADLKEAYEAALNKTFSANKYNISTALIKSYHIASYHRNNVKN